MSRTDRTKPLWVRHAEHDPRPVHDHRHGPCDLPPRPSRLLDETRCRWEHPGALTFTRRCCSGCAVRGCIRERQAMTKTANRKARYAGRRAVRRHATGDNAD
ncbi:hypothetical protein [Phytomonospora endophytica]|uniref:Uncharacterized protein n=1 Tax=Phytomonospora endophytica TaxID=714109 RepID=A0A841FE22_9ACTN|nr:hypothetical protein [Phytomonospora endophytica]MBB6033755.1 hypothetical protein [Phytomonospora endophytica]GIG64728.1 hypothetical protein Pen01_10230 [Phytomonospora endophytica]